MLPYRLLRTVGLGVGSALLAMAIFPLVAKAARPVMDSAIRGGLSLKDLMKQAYAENKDKFEDLVAEVKEEKDAKGKTGKTKKGN